MKLKLLASLLLAASLGTTLLACGSSEAEDEAWRSRVIEDYVHGQEAYYAWPDGSVKATDEDGYVLIEEFSEDSSYRTSEKYSYASADDPLATYAAAGQVEADLLKYSLRKNVLLCVYSSDDYLLNINFGRYPDATEQANNRAEEKIDELAAAAKGFAARNKDAWLEGFKADILAKYGDSYSDATYDPAEPETRICVTLLPDWHLDSGDEEWRQGFDEWWQRCSDSITLYTGTDVQLELVSSDTGEVEQTYLSQAWGYVYDPANSPHE